MLDSIGFDRESDGLREKARELHRNAYNLCTLHWLGLAHPTQKSHKCLTELYQWLTGKGLAKYL
jgi:hypothetical protein